MAILELRAEESPAPRRDTLLGILDGPGGIEQTIQYMVQWARAYKVNPDIIALTGQIYAGLPSKSYFAEVQAVQNFVRGSIRYQQDVEGVETLRTPIDTINLGFGDCDDQALLVATLLLASGHLARYAVLAFTGPRDFEHVFTETLIGERWYSVETTEDVPVGWYPPDVMGRKTYTIPSSAIILGL